MKVFWWQGGLHLEPENKTETDALTLLWEAKKESPAGSAEPSDSSDSSSSVVNE